MHLELQSGATHMPQQIDVRDHRKCNDHDNFKNFAARLQMNRDAEPFGTCVEMSTLARTRSKAHPGSLGSFLGVVIDLTIVSSRKFSVVCSRIDMSICSRIRNYN
jgi:hypothetical protein